jgi:heterodisulfide reductase subunit A-like polyferredoxin
MMDNLAWEDITEFLQKKKDVEAILMLDMACSPRGQQGMMDFIATNKITKLVAAACSPLIKGKVFEEIAYQMGIPRQLLEIVNLREQCSWAIKEPELSLENAKIKLNMSLKKLSKTKDLGHWSINKAYINTLKCDKCKRCMEECPNKAISLDPDGYPAVDGNKCVKCGVCLGGCPLGAISLPNFRLEEISGMIEEVAKSKSEPSLLGFFCPHAYEEVDVVCAKGCSEMANLNIIPVPCSGAVNMTLVNDALSAGIDGVIIAGCEYSQCQERKGNEYAKKRIANQQSTLEEMFLEKERLTYMSFDENYTPSAEIENNTCSSCGLCESVCPFKAISYSQETGKMTVNGKGCRCCGNCAASCPSGSIKIPEYSNEEILSTIDLLLGEGF